METWAACLPPVEPPPQRPLTSAWEIKAVTNGLQDTTKEGALSSCRYKREASIRRQKCNF